jgi:catechol 2,3-dioxygenase-like lactoylglutathione lyase family enzyme
MGDPSPAGEPGGQETGPLIWDHVGLNVADLDATAAWYIQVLGLRLENEFQVPHADLRGKMLVHQSGFRLELIQRPGATAGIQAANPAEAALTRGLGHFAVQVPDLDMAYERLIAAGAAARVPPADAPRAGARMAWVADCEGNLIELITTRIHQVPQGTP